MRKRKNGSKRFVTLRKTGKSAGFVMTSNYVLRSDEYLKLSIYARNLILFFQSHYRPDKGYVGMSIRQAAAFLNSSNNTARKTLKELIDAHFISVHIEGNFARNKGTRYKLSWCGTDTSDPTDLWDKEVRDYEKAKAKNKEATRAQIKEMSKAREKETMSKTA